MVKHYKKADPYKLDNPEPGFVYWWVTTSDQGQYSSCLHAGLEPVKAVDEPNLFDGGAQTDAAGNYRYRELILCKIDETYKKERDEHMKALADARAIQLANPTTYVQSHPHIGAELTMRRDGDFHISG